MITRLLSPLPLLLLIAPLALAQIPIGPNVSSQTDGRLDNMTYTLSGKVTDTQGNPLDGAHITASEVGSGRILMNGMSLPDGSFQLPSMRPGEYLLSASSGLYQVQQRITLDGPFADVILRVPIHRDDGGVAGGSTVSVSQFQAPKEARKLLQKAQKAYEKQDHKQAIQKVDEALQRFPDFSEALTFRALLYLQDNQGNQARELSEKAIQQDPSYGLGYVVLGAAYNMLSRFDDALRVLGRAFSFTPKSWQGYYESARAHLGKKQYAEALQSIDKAAQYAPKDFASIHLVRAEACLGLQDFPQATAALKAFLATDPKGMEAKQARQVLQQVESTMSHQAAVGR